jgi:predicted DsbA family dithiol-disulfide isomerase
MPFELRPYPTPTLRPEDPYLPRVWNASVYPIAARMGVDIKLPTISPQPYTHLAFEGLEFAKEQGKAHAYNDSVMRAFFQRDLDIGKIDVLEKLAAEVGLERTVFRQALEIGKFRERHQQLLQHAYEEVGVTGVSLFIIGDIRYPVFRIVPRLEKRYEAALSNISFWYIALGGCYGPCADCRAGEGSRTCAGIAQSK